MQILSITIKEAIDIARKRPTVPAVVVTERLDLFGKFCIKCGREQVIAFKDTGVFNADTGERAVQGLVICTKPNLWGRPHSQQLIYIPTWLKEALLYEDALKKTVG